MTGNPTVTAINAAMDVAAEVADGRINPAQIEALAAAECRRLFGQVTGPDDPLWPLQLDVCRRVLGAGGVPADELAEWLAVARAAEGVTSGGNGFTPMSQAEVGGPGDDAAMPEVEIPEPPMPDVLTLDGAIVTATEEPNGAIDSVPPVEVGDRAHVLDSDCWCDPEVMVVEGRRRRTHRDEADA